MSDTHAHAANSGSANHSEAHQEHSLMAHAKPYLFVGGVLIVFTAITVWLSYVDFDKLFGGHGWNVVIAMIVATFKVCLVGAIFMHLKGEVSTIWRPIYFTLFFFAGLFLLTLLHFYDPIFSTVHSHH